jgi:hypothetical protein
MNSQTQHTSYYLSTQGGGRHNVKESEREEKEKETKDKTGDTEKKKARKNEEVKH